MKRTGATPIIVSALVGLVGMYLTEMFVVSRGLDTIQPPLSLAVTLFLAAVIVVLVAIPVRRAVNGKGREPINPFYAARVVALAKATIIVGSLGFGAGFGVIFNLISRPTLPPIVAFGSSVALILTAALLVIGGSVAEHLCTLPPDDPEEEKKQVGDVPA